jgi:hypothetical protein
MGRALGLVLFAIVVTGCGSGMDDPAPVSPAQACQNFVDARCNKEAECAVPTDRARVLEDCQFVFKINIDCSEVQGLGPTYSACLADTNALSCASYDPQNGLPSPSSCKGILLK